MAENTLSKGIKNFKFSFIAQAVILLVGVLKTLLVPSVLTVEAYAYWQLYLFYIGYVGFLYLGYNDGILLKYGKYNYDELPFEKLRRSMQFYSGMLCVFSVAVLCFSLCVADAQKAFVFRIIAASVLLYGLNGVFIYVFLITNRIKLHSFFTAVDSVSSFLGILLLLVLKQTDFHLLVWFVFGAKLLSVLAMAILCRKMLFGKRAPVREGFREFIDNIRVGIFLMLAQVMSMLVTGLGRILIEYGGALDDYAYYSFGMTVMNTVMVGVTAVATVMYPTLGRLDKPLLPRVFDRMYGLFSHFTAAAPLLYFPGYVLIGIFFPNYTPMLGYLSVLFVTMTWQSKVTVSTNSYFRVLRMERKMLLINILSLGVFCAAYFLLERTVGRFFDNRIYLVAIATALSMLSLELLAERTVCKRLGLRFRLTFLRDLAMNAVFLLTTLITDKLLGFGIYAFVVALYALLRRRQIKNDLLSLLRAARRRN